LSTEGRLPTPKTLSHFFLFLYNFFKNHRVAFAVFLTATVGFAIFFASKIQLEEDIAKIIPSDEKVEKLNFLFQNSKFVDKLILNISLSDSNAATDPDKLIDYTNDLVASLEGGFVSQFIDDITYNIPEDALFEAHDFIYNNLPVYLVEQNYEQLETLTSDEAIASAVEKNYKLLITPASFILKNSLIRDPLNLSTIPLKNLESLQFDDNFELHDGYIITKDKKNLLLFISPSNASKETAENAKMLTGLDSVLVQTSLKYQGEVKGEYFGGVAVAVGNAQRIKQDVKLTVSLALVVLLFFIWWFFREKFMFLIILLPVLLGGGLAIALLFLLKTKVSAISLGVGSVLLGITIDYSLHLVTHFRSTGSIKTLLKDISVPIIMSCVTTASAFLCLMLVSSEALQELGLFAALSVCCAAMFSLIVLPHLLKEGKPKFSSPPLINRITSFKMHQSKPIVAGVILISFACLFTYDKVTFETDMMKMNYLSDELAAAEKNINKVSSATVKSIYLVSSGADLEEALVNNEKVIDKIQQLKEDKIVREYTSVGSLVLSKELQGKRISMWNQFWTTEKKEHVKQKLIEESLKYKFKETAFNQFYDLLNKEFKPLGSNEFKPVKEQFLNDYITEGNNVTTVATLIKADRKNKGEIFEALSDSEGSVVMDKEYLTSQFVNILKEDFNLLVGISLLLVFIILVFFYGRIELGIIAFIPMALSWLWTLGIMGALDLKFNIFNIIISTFIFGLGIDYSIFIMRGLLQEYKYGRKNLSSYKTSIFLSVVTTITGLGVLIFAEHPALRSIALLSIIGILSVVIIAYTIEPLMFRWLVYIGKRKRTAPVTMFIFIYSVICYTYFYILAIIVVIVGLTGFRLIPSYYRKRLLRFIMTYVARSTIYIMFLTRKKIINPNKEKFSKPAIIISNHQSLIDIPLAMMLSPKVIVLTHDWVWNSPIIGFLVQQVEYYPASSIEKNLEKLRKLTEEGYSIFIFPEGTRAEDLKVKRFHKGAFYLAEQLNLDILPIIIHGTGHYVTKGEYYGKKSITTVKILERIKLSDSSYGTNHRERAKLIGKYFRDEFDKVCESYQYPAYYRNRLIKNYIYKGPILEWYTRIKTALEDNYQMFHDLIPKKCTITDIGCGYGYLTYMLHFLSEKRTITGIDYDKDKIDVANNCMSKNENINFVSADVSGYEFQKSDVFILNDVLHYLPRADQHQLLENCKGNLNDGGMIIVRDGDKDLEKRHLGTRLSEFFSTNLGFNKARNKLDFVSGRDLLGWIERNHMKAEIIDNTKLTSNLVFVIRQGSSEAKISSNGHV